MIFQNVEPFADQLRDVVPSFPFEKRISKIETLRLAASYIELLLDTLNQPERPSGAGMIYLFKLYSSIYFIKQFIFHFFSKLCLRLTSCTFRPGKGERTF